MKFTFKTEKATGRYRSFCLSEHIIKFKKKVVGNIEDKAPYKIGLMVYKKDIKEDGNPNCSWKWIWLIKESTSLDEAKAFLNEKIESLFIRYNIRSSE